MILCGVLRHNKAWNQLNFLQGGTGEADRLSAHVNLSTFKMTIESFRWIVGGGEKVRNSSALPYRGYQILF